MIKHFAGKVAPPTDMMSAAKASLEQFPHAFEDLMQQTKGAAPTPDELCKMVDACRQAQQQQ